MKTLLFVILAGCGSKTTDDKDPSSGDDTDILHINELLSAPCDGGTPPDNGAPAGDDLHRVFLSDPEAVCNDGSPALVYVRAAENAEEANNWVFWVQGGGECNDHAGCRARWCGTDSKYEADSMSSDWTLETIKGKGILKRNSTNEFGGANQVYMYYCSSDSWTGQRTDVILTDETGELDAFRIDFNGRRIMEAVVEELADGVTSDDGAETVPALTNAETVIFSGSSAGASGITHNLDWVAEQFPASTNISGVLDATLNPESSTITNETVAAQWDARLLESFQQSELTRDPIRDQSCLDFHVGDPDACTTTHTRLNHITTKIFQRMALLDSHLVSHFQSLDPTVSPIDVGTWVQATMLMFPDLPTTAEDDVGVTPGAFGPGCAEHTALTNDIWFFDATVEDPSGTPRSFHDALAFWLEGSGDIAIIDSVPPTISVCPD